MLYKSLPFTLIFLVKFQYGYQKTKNLMLILNPLKKLSTSLWWKILFFYFYIFVQTFLAYNFLSKLFCDIFNGVKISIKFTFLKPIVKFSKKNFGVEGSNLNNIIIYVESLMVAKESLLKSFWAALTAIGLIVCNKTQQVNILYILISELLKTLQKSRWKNLSSGVWLLRVHFYLRMFPPLTSFR